MWGQKWDYRQFDLYSIARLILLMHQSIHCTSLPIMHGVNPLALACCGQLSLYRHQPALPTFFLLPQGFQAHWTEGCPHSRPSTLTSRSAPFSRVQMEWRVAWFCKSCLPPQLHVSIHILADPTQIQLLLCVPLKSSVSPCASHQASLKDT